MGTTRMNVALHNIADILSGVFQQPSQEGDASFLLLSHFDDDGNRKPEEHTPMVEQARVAPHHVLRNGDVLVAAKGGRNFAVLHSAAYGAAVASPSFLVVRLTVPHVLPSYVAMYLNLCRVQLAAMARGTSMPSISKTALSAFQLPVPPVPRQQELVELHALWQREKDLMQRIIHEKTTLYTSLLLHSAEHSL